MTCIDDSRYGADLLRSSLDPLAHAVAALGTCERSVPLHILLSHPATAASLYHSLLLRMIAAY